ncbi:MAG: phosphoglycerate kinase [Patescibacteria group bacterium]|nr:phosphoglycerate kinase [Patescibacteria group bacterium]
MKLPLLPPSKSLKGKKIFLRVDWNVPLKGAFAADESLKILRSAQTIKDLSSRGAIVLVATHLGRPKKREAEYSTENLLKRLPAEIGLKPVFLGDALDEKTGLENAAKKIVKATPGDVFLLENVRFYTGEEKNDLKLAKAYVALSDFYMNDAFASSHRAHASIVAVAKLLPSYAGPTLVQEVSAMEKLLGKPKRPYVALIGGAKLTTKLPVIDALLKVADKVMIGGAMAHPFFAVKKIEIGKSYTEKEGLAAARKMIKNPKIILPLDVVVARKVAPGAKASACLVGKVNKTEAIGDIGPQTMQAWSAEIKKAKTIVWNGPLGVADIPAFSHGSLVIARAMAIRSKGEAYGVVGGGDTLPVVMESGMDEWFDHISTGGGAMLEFIAKKGKLPGLAVLNKK